MPSQRPDPIYAHIGARIREERMARGLSMADLAAELEVTRRQIRNYEKGLRWIPIAHIAGIARLLQMPRVDLLPKD